MMKESEIYLKAAELLDANKGETYKFMYGCCDFINNFSTDKQLCRFMPPVDKFAELFAPRHNELYWGDQWSDDADERYQCRVLALLFMHQIALDEERGKK